MRKSLDTLLDSLRHLADRTPQMAFDGGAEDAFTEVAPYRDGAIYLGHYSGASEWERHANGDEIVMAVDGSTTVVLWRDGAEERVPLKARELVVVPAGVWHRFEDSRELKVFTVTPQPTDHRLERPDESA